ncbi:MAG: hypothetical protein E6K71_10545 [Candidatus Eisenbacteria bacterium]|uniref:Cytochrome c-552/4 domain-containing protein n=1 Tax=Eiseniibacteriota bacterium TaxID=2212470 RepID=A0A538S770_UNCEI|nr:MAG: hypothetical protein E6K71_10545 [Candidatus Eisenbacteria bacterium]
MIRSFAPWHRYFALLVLALAAPAYTPPPLMRTTLNPQSAQTCLTCHVDITQQWGSSAHAQADRKLNLLFGRMYFASLQETRGATLVKCGPCHETEQYVTNDFDKVRPVSEEGITCVFCHGISGPGPTDAVPPVTLELGPYFGPIRNPVPVKDHASKYSEHFTKSAFCGSCHQYENQNGILISDTFGEWKRSKYAKAGVTCQSCHMPGSPGRVSSLGPARPRVADHSFHGPDKNRALQGAATLVLKLGKRGTENLRVLAVVTNVGAGHAIPTGNDQHLLLIRVRATDTEGHILWENDPFRDSSGSIFGLILANDLGAYPAETWAAAKVVADRRIQTGSSAQAAYEIPVGEAKGAVKIDAVLLYRKARPETIQLYNLPEDVYGAERRVAQATLTVQNP